MIKQASIGLCLATVAGILLTVAQPSDSRSDGGGHAGGGAHGGGGGGHVAVAHGGGNVGHFAGSGGHGGGVPIARGGYRDDRHHYHQRNVGYGYPAYYGTNYNNGDYRNYGGYPNCNSGGSGVGAAIGSVVSGLLGAAHGHGYD